MVFETIRRKLRKAVAPRKVKVSQWWGYVGDDRQPLCVILCIKLANDGHLVGGFHPDAEIDFDAIAAQCEAEEAKGIVGGGFIIEGTKAIYYGQFEHLDPTEVVIPDSVTEIGRGAFDGCTSLNNK